MNCDFKLTDEPRDASGRYVFRCVNSGCTNAVRCDDAELIHPAKCRAPVLLERLERAGIATCVHRGELTGQLVKGCGCHVPESDKRYYHCAEHGKCVLFRLAKRPAVRSCEGCGSLG